MSSLWEKIESKERKMTSSCNNTLAHPPLKIEHMGARSHKPGMTLIEIILVISILVVIGSVCIARLEAWGHVRALEQSCRILSSELNAARVLAVEKSAPVIMRYASGARTYVLLTPSHTWSKKKELPDGVTFSQRNASSAGSGENEIWFLPDGTCQQSLIRVVNETGDERDIMIHRHTGEE